MDPWAPINGISLERYAELSAELDGTQDPNKQAEIVGKLGVQRPDWEAAKAGWTARMQDMSLMGQVATRFMPMYQAALAKKSGGVPTVSFEDYVAMSGAVPVVGIEGMLQHYQVTMSQWTQIAGHWNGIIPTNPQYMQFGMLVEQEAARIRAGGPLKQVRVGAPAAAPAQPGMAQPGMPQPGMPGASPYAAAANPYAQAAAANPYAQAAGMNPYAQAAAANPYAQPQANPYAQPGVQPGAPNANPYAQQQQANPYAQQNPYAQPAAVGAQMGSALNSFGNAMGSFFEGAVGAFSVGSRVMVQWSDGNRYPATVANSQAGQLEVAFPDGRRVWVPQAYVSMIY